VATSRGPTSRGPCLHHWTVAVTWDVSWLYLHLWQLSLLTTTITLLLFVYHQHYTLTCGHNNNYNKLIMSVTGGGSSSARLQCVCYRQIQTTTAFHRFIRHLSTVSLRVPYSTRDDTRLTTVGGGVLPRSRYRTSRPISVQPWDAMARH